VFFILLYFISLLTRSTRHLAVAADMIISYFTTLTVSLSKSASDILYLCTVHLDIKLLHSPTDALIH
jgi:hypothetical protein